MHPPNSSHEVWWWNELLRRLDEAGYTIIRKKTFPEGVGLSAAKKEEWRRSQENK
jgi:hypothetical protein